MLEGEWCWNASFGFSCSQCLSLLIAFSNQLLLISGCGGRKGHCILPILDCELITSSTSPILVLGLFVFFFFLRLNDSEKYCYIETCYIVIWKNSRCDPLSKNVPGVTHGPFSVSIIYITSDVVTYIEDRCTLMIYYLCWENRNMASITMACLWQNASPQKPLVLLSWLPGKHSPFYLSEKKLQNPMNENSGRGTISSGKLQEDFWQGGEATH